MVFINSAYACVHVCELNIITKWDSYDLLQCRENADGVQRVQGWNARQNPKKTPWRSQTGSHIQKELLLTFKCFCRFFHRSWAGTYESPAFVPNISPSAKCVFTYFWMPPLNGARSLSAFSVRLATSKHVQESDSEGALKRRGKLLPRHRIFGRLDAKYSIRQEFIPTCHFHARGLRQKHQEKHRRAWAPSTNSQLARLICERHTHAKREIAVAIS